MGMYIRIWVTVHYVVCLSHLNLIYIYKILTWLTKLKEKARQLN